MADQLHTQDFCSSQNGPRKCCSGRNLLSQEYCMELQVHSGDEYESASLSLPSMGLSQRLPAPFPF